MRITQSMSNTCVRNEDWHDSNTDTCLAWQLSKQRAENWTWIWQEWEQVPRSIKLGERRRHLLTALLTEEGFHNIEIKVCDIYCWRNGQTADYILSAWTRRVSLLGSAPGLQQDWLHVKTRTVPNSRGEPSNPLALSWATEQRRVNSLILQSLRTHLEREAAGTRKWSGQHSTDIWQRRSLEGEGWKGKRWLQ